MVQKITDFIESLNLNYNVNTDDKITQIDVSVNNATIPITYNENVETFQFTMPHNNSTKIYPDFETFCKKFRVYIHIFTVLLPQAEETAKIFSKLTKKLLALDKFMGNSASGFRFTYNVVNQDESYSIEVGEKITIFSDTGISYVFENTETGIKYISYVNNIVMLSEEDANISIKTCVEEPNFMMAIVNGNAIECEYENYTLKVVSFNDKEVSGVSTNDIFDLYKLLEMCQEYSSQVQENDNKEALPPEAYETDLSSDTANFKFDFEDEQSTTVEEQVTDAFVEEPVAETAFEEPVNEEPVIEEQVTETFIEEPITEEPVNEAFTEDSVTETFVEEPVTETNVEESVNAEPVVETVIEKEKKDIIEVKPDEGDTMELKLDNDNIHIISKGKIYTIAKDKAKSYGFPVNRIANEVNYIVKNGIKLTEDEAKYKVFAEDVTDNESFCKELLSLIFE